jgi:hypothetical protein
VLDSSRAIWGIKAAGRSGQQDGDRRIGQDFAQL